VSPACDAAELADGLLAAFDDVAPAERDVVRTPASCDVGLEAIARAVKAVADQLDGESDLRPVAVDLVASSVDVRLRDRQPVLAEQRKEALLQRTQSHLTCQGGPQQTNAGASGVACHARDDLAWRRAVSDTRFVAGADQVFKRQQRSEVQQQSRDGHHADPVERRGVEAMQLANPMHLDAGPATRAGSDDCHLGRWRLLGLQHLQQMSLGAMAEASARPARENGRDVVALHGWSEVADGVDAAMQPAQPTVREPPRDTRSIRAEPQQLCTCDAPVLQPRLVRRLVEE